MGSIHLTVLIRTRNEAKSLVKVFEALANQITSFEWEILVVDNDSQDETLKLCKEYNARVVNIPQNEFSYGKSLNLGMREAKGEVVVVISAHSLPISRNFLELAAEPFRENSRLAAARCLGLSSTSQIASWFKPKYLMFDNAEDQRNYESGIEWLTSYPAATGAVYRRSVCNVIRFDENLESVEDKIWASAALRAGYVILSCCEAMFMYIREMGWVEGIVRNNRKNLALYRARKMPSMSLLGFVKTVIIMLLRTCRQFFQSIVKDIWTQVYILLLPLLSKGAPRIGSFKEFDRKK